MPQPRRMGIGAKFGRAVRRTDEPQPDGSVLMLVGGVWHDPEMTGAASSKGLEH